MELGREDGKACSVERPSVFCVSHCRKVWLVLDSRYLMTWPDMQQLSVRTDPDEVPCNLVADRSSNFSMLVDDRLSPEKHKYGVEQGATSCSCL